MLFDVADWLGVIVGPHETVLPMPLESTVQPAAGRPSRPTATTVITSVWPPAVSVGVVAPVGWLPVGWLPFGACPFVWVTTSVTTDGAVDVVLLLHPVSNSPATTTAAAAHITRA
ncbi:MAG: hypothetical protein WAW85_05345 [Gordonia sp. (in: high G+C Gram-positive bacteria)]|uniref:hypothetical protein n=1 Tax=Gordonia sp. (in: high G+C Gram-positive bacteria) TaxID=84139 RepID=UPI003BB77CDB